MYCFFLNASYSKICDIFYFVKYLSLLDIDFRVNLIFPVVFHIALFIVKAKLKFDYEISPLSAKSNNRLTSIGVFHFPDKWLGIYFRRILRF